MCSDVYLPFFILIASSVSVRVYYSGRHDWFYYTSTKCTIPDDMVLFTCVSSCAQQKAYVVMANIGYGHGGSYLRYCPGLPLWGCEDPVWAVWSPGGACCVMVSPRVQHRQHQPHRPLREILWVLCVLCVVDLFSTIWGLTSMTKHDSGGLPLGAAVRRWHKNHEERSTALLTWAKYEYIDPWWGSCMPYWVGPLFL